MKFMDLSWIGSTTEEDHEGIEAFATAECSDNQWIFDTGATVHMSNNQVQEATSFSASVIVASGSKNKMTGIG